MKKTNSKEVMKAIESKIIESYEAAEEYFSYDGKTAKDARRFSGGFFSLYWRKLKDWRR